MIDLRNSGLPSTIEVGGRSFFIYTDYRRWIDFGAELREQSIDYDYLISFIDGTPPPIIMFEELLEKLAEFYSLRSYAPHDLPAMDPNTPDVIDFILDGEYIYGSILAYYGIDIIDIDYLHWYKFRAMIDCLKDTKINDIIEYRSYKTPPSKYDPDREDRERKTIKAYWSLPIHKTEEDRKVEERFNSLFYNT